jgi:membrane protein required for colicin V production
MNLFDFVVLIIVCYCLVRGCFRGLVKESFSIIGVLAGFYGAYTYYPRISTLLAGWIPNEGHGNILAFMIVFFVVFFVVSILGIIIRYLINTFFSGWVDRVGGIVLGILRGGLIVAVVFIALTAFLPKKTPFLQNSRLSPYVARYAEMMAEVIGKDMKASFKNKYNGLKEGWRQKK